MTESPQTPVVLPEGVGNRELDRLHEIVPPEAVAWTPQTVGWYLLVAAVVLAALWMGLRLWRRWVANRFRRQALAELALIEGELQSSASGQQALRALPDLLKRTALAARARTEVASLTGAEWLAYLDSGLGGDDFSAGDGRLLGEIAYQPGNAAIELSEERVVRLVGLARRWIRRGV